jgi:hypothetical protein
MPQLRTRCAGEEAVPNTCVGDARPCAERGGARARFACPSDHAKSERKSPPLHLRPLGRYSSGAGGTTAARAGALEPSANELIGTTFSCYRSSKSADTMPKGAPTIWTHAQHAALLMHLQCCNFRPTGPFGIAFRAGCAMDGDVGLIPHCHWPSRTIYGTSARKRVASCWA